ncbi:tRNA epoxyqueuosine(34) reductase QueG [Alkaliphilus serpentinus]|uniref:tRNA epoxyqueuosine(34) reductase QueG n=1 Tax=Alkaliphilus serpentinus TaxID=1482731 RepID=UPI0018657003|nr:tRNA epoxyqueuosine(34) reductase QueG [Alkaliphilus serpentinus]
MALKEDIIEYSKSLGIDLIGFTSAEAFEELRPILASREALGHLSGFEEGVMEKRINPRLTMEDAESIIVIGQSYYHDVDQKNKPRYHGELARTAWGRDYHFVLMEKLTNLAEYIKKLSSNLQYKAFVDTGPLVDRHVAHRAGLGWYGYNSTLINEGYGSWFFIGYLLTNLQLQPDKTLEDQCAGCNLCVEQCPGGAIEGPYSFNANKCLSYVLQQRETIPHEKRGNLGNRLYGCDICQLVCPHNKEVKASKEEAFIPKDLPHHVDLVQLINITSKDFKTLFNKNASGWRGKKTLQRNAIIALGNCGDQEAIKYLMPLLKDPRREIREYALGAVYKLDKNAAVKAAEEYDMTHIIKELMAKDEI